MVRVTGTLVLDDIRTFLAQVAGATEFTPDTDTIWDVREADLSLLTYEMSQEILSLRLQLADRKGARFAVVVGDALGMGVTRAFQSVFGIHSGQSETDVLVCKDIDEARAWLLGGRVP